MALQNTMKAMGGLSGQPKADPEMEALKKQYAQARKGLAARSGESLRQADLLQKRAAYQAGGLGGAGIKMAQKTQADVQRGIAGEEANLGMGEAAQTGQVLGQRAERAFTAEEAAKQRAFAGGEAAKERAFTGAEAAKTRAWEQKQRDTENALNTKIAGWNMTQTEMNDRFNRFIAASKEGLNTPEEWGALWSGLSTMESGYGRTGPSYGVPKATTDATVNQRVLDLMKQGYSRDTAEGLARNKSIW